MNLQELRNQLEIALADLDVMEVLDPETSEFRAHKKTASISISNAFGLFAPCPHNAGCDGCKCGYDGNDPEDDGEIGGGGGGGM